MKRYILAIVSMILLLACGRNPQVNTSKFSPIIFADKDTGLMWRQDGKEPTYAVMYEDTLAFCNDSAFEGYNDWRVPTIQELVTLLHYYKNPKKSGSNTKFKDTFEAITEDLYWSLLVSSTLNSKGHYLVLNVKEGSTKFLYPIKDTVVRIICVRGKKKPIY